MSNLLEIYKKYGYQGERKEYGNIFDDDYALKNYLRALNELTEEEKEEYYKLLDENQKSLYLEDHTLEEYEALKKETD